MQESRYLYCELDIFEGFKNKAIKTMFYVIFNPELFVKLTPFHQDEAIKFIRDQVTKIYINRRNNPEMGYELCPKCKGYKVIIKYQNYRYGGINSKYSYVESEEDKKRFSNRKLYTGHNIDTCDYYDLNGQVDFIQYITKTKKDSKGKIINIQLKGVNNNIPDDPF
jgi:hypothetical protein